jgi:hypothetical protein
MEQSYRFAMYHTVGFLYQISYVGERSSGKTIHRCEHSRKIGSETNGGWECKMDVPGLG